MREGEALSAKARIFGGRKRAGTGWSGINMRGRAAYAASMGETNYGLRKDDFRLQWRVDVKERQSSLPRPPEAYCSPFRDKDDSPYLAIPDKRDKSSSRPSLNARRLGNEAASSVLP